MEICLAPAGVPDKIFIAITSTCDLDRVDKKNYKYVP
jgi:hypothetical protein